MCALVSVTQNPQHDQIAVADPGVSGRRRKPKLGPLLPIGSLVAAILICAGIFIVDGFNIQTLLVALRSLTKVSVLVFILVFVTRPLHDLVRSSVTTWMLANRRYLGLSFAAWHLMHWPILGSLMALEGPALFWKYSKDFAIPAGCVLLVISLMAATSSNRAVRFLGKPLWSAIHTVGLYTIWVWFFRVYWLRLPKHEIHGYVNLGLLAAALTFRWAIGARRIMTKKS
ncbi:MAG: putative sulfite oxidase subunit YedZ [Myxococcales bacterium]|nr:putative sulfite oxidase subunit YedZ [Myxococcales bacterium]